MRKHTKKKKNGQQGTPASQKSPRRGPFHAKTTGVSMGGGQSEPTGFFHSIFTALVMAQLFATPPLQRLAGFINGMYQSYAPDLHGFYSSTMELLYQWKPSLPRNFDALTSVFAAATINFGPFTVTRQHLDFANLMWGWCAVTALGNFNPDLGGHLILWDLKLVIGFPPGCTIFIPSAILHHSNVSIQQGEKHFSFTQFTAAGIFRFVHNGFRTEKQIHKANLSQAERQERARERAERWVEGMKMYKIWNVPSE
ncbi:hypothetical protein FB451DRAFT_1139849 [Mycena latifolia]|nr:hypothetical protein FB451DRAFT_1139849 [Mycena latifolia]